MDISLKELRPGAMKYGLLLGVIILVLDLIALYVLAYSESLILVSTAYLLGYIILPIIAAIILIKRLRDDIGHYWVFRQATSGIFIMFLCAYLISTAGNFIYLKYIHPDVTLAAKDNFISLFTGFLSKISASPDKIDEAIESIEMRFSQVAVPGFSEIISGLLSSIIIIFICALIFAAIFKKDPPILFPKSDPSQPD